MGLKLVSSYDRQAAEVFLFKAIRGFGNKAAFVY